MTRTRVAASWRLMMLVILIMTGLVALAPSVLAVEGVLPAATTFAAHSYDHAANLPATAVADDGRSNASGRPVADASVRSLASLGELHAPEAIRGLQFADEAAQGFGSMSSFRRAYGSAGPNAQWHHIVEQHTGNVGRFGAESIHNTSNIIRLDTTIHRQMSGYYSSIQPFTGGQTVRQWLGTQPFDAQRQFGLDVLQRFGATG